MFDEDRLKKLPQDKHDCIVQAALDVFSQKGYVKATTQGICEAAGISKGLLFHYFGTKKNCFAYVLDHITKKMTIRLHAYMPQRQMDIFELITESSVAKLRISQEMPKEYRIIYDAYIQTPDELKDLIDDQVAKSFSGQREAFYALVETAKFQPNIDAKQAVDLIFACSKGMYDIYLEQFKKCSPEEALLQIDVIKDDMLKMFDILRSAIYL